MQKEEYFIKNTCYSVTKYYLCKRNNKRSFFSSKQRHKAFRSFPNRYLFSCINKVTSLFSVSCILRVILVGKSATFEKSKLFFKFLNSYLNVSRFYFTAFLNVKPLFFY